MDIPLGGKPLPSGLQIHFSNSYNLCTLEISTAATNAIANAGLRVR